MILKKASLLKALKAVRPGLANKAFVESFVKFMFTGKQLITYNGRILIAYPYSTEDFSFSILAEPFYQFISKVKAAKLDLQIKHGNLKIKGVGVMAEIAVETDPEKPEVKIPPSKSKKWRPLPNDFIFGLKMCLMSVGTDPSDAFSNILFKEDGTIISSDDARVSTFKSDGNDETSFLIPGSSAQELVNFDSENIESYLVEESMVYFKSENGAIFCTTRANNEFPEEMLNYFNFKGNKYKLPIGLKLAVESAMIMNDDIQDIDRKINVKVSNGRILCKSEGEIGWVETSSKLKLGKKEVQFIINPIFFSHILDHSTLMIIGEDRALFKTDNFKHLVSLVED